MLMAADIDHSLKSRFLLVWGQLLVLFSIICTFAAYAVDAVSDTPVITTPAVSDETDTSDTAIQSRLLPTLTVPEPSTEPVISIASSNNAHPDKKLMEKIEQEIADHTNETDLLNSNSP